jgi:hypothetical protein
VVVAVGHRRAIVYERSGASTRLSSAGPPGSLPT